MRDHVRFDVYDFGTYYMVRGSDLQTRDVAHVKCDSAEEGRKEAVRRLEARKVNGGGMVQ